MSSFLEVEDEFTVQLIKAIPAGGIAFHALGQVRHPQISLGKRLLEFCRKGYSLIDVGVIRKPMALTPLPDPFQHIRRADRLGRHGMYQATDNVTIDLLKRIHAHHGADVPPGQVTGDIE